jgi:hypothetical protein
MKSAARDGDNAPRWCSWTSAAAATLIPGTLGAPTDTPPPPHATLWKTSRQIPETFGDGGGVQRLATVSGAVTNGYVAALTVGV